jgi:hypothetical protein
VSRIAGVPFDLGSAVTSIRAVAGKVPRPAEIAAEIAAGFEHVCGTRLAPSGQSPSLTARAAELEVLYRSSEWTWRR